MATNDIKQKIVLEGEKEYNRALSDAKRNLKTLKSELKAETAELGANATAQQKNETKIKSLQKQIKEQEKIVKTYKEALAEVKEKYSDNEDAIAKWEQKLNEARASLGNMKNELENVGKGFKDVENSAGMATVAGKSVADSLGNLSEIGSTISAGIESAFMGMMDRVRDVCAQIWDLIAETAAKADRWGDLAGFYGSTAEEVQEIDRAVSAAGANFEDFISLMNQLQFKNKDKALVDWLGISDVNYDDNVEFTLLALQKMYELKNKLGAAKFNDQLGEVFSGKSAGFLELIDKYATIMDKRKQLKEYGYLLDSNELDVMSEVNNTLFSIEEKWDMLKSKFATGFGTVTLDIMANIEGSLDAIAKYFNAKTPGEREAALRELETNITEMFETAKQAIKDGIATLDSLAEELKQSQSPAARALGEALDKLVEVLKWFGEEKNWKTVENGFKAIIGVWAAFKIGSIVAKIIEFTAQLAIIKTGGGILASLFGGTSAAATAATAGTTAGASWGAAFAAAVAKAAPWLIGLYTLLNPSSTSDDDLDALWDKNGNPTTAGREAGITWTYEENEQRRKQLEETGEGLADAAQVIDEAAKNFDNTSKNLAPVIDLTTKTYQPTSMADADWRPSYMRGISVAEALDEIEDLVLDEIFSDQQKNDAVQDWWDAWREGAEDEAANFDWMQEVFGDEFGEVWDTIVQRLDELGEKQMELEDLPSEWWQSQGGNSGNQDGLTGADAKNMTDAVNKMPGAVQRGMSGIRVYMDGQTVGHLVAPYVSQYIGMNIG